MKTFRIILPAVLAILFLASAGMLHAQPGFRSEIEKEYDENGNIIRIDSSWSCSYHSGQGPDLDSIFRQFFDGHTHAFDFDRFHRFPLADSALQDAFRFEFPDPFFDDDFIDMFGDFPFPDFGELFEHFHFDGFLHDSMNQFYPDWRHFPGPPPGHQKKSARKIEI